MKTFTIILYSDPEKSWAKIKRSVLDDLGLSEYISNWSYQRGHYVYLDDDEDLPMVCQRINDHGTSIKFVEKRSNRDSKIRSYERYEYGFDNVAFSTTR